MSRGCMINGVWKTGEDVDPSRTTKDFVNKIEEGHEYVLYAAVGCPFAHSARLALRLKNLENRVTEVLAEVAVGNESWYFSDRRPDTVYGKRHLHEVYAHLRPDFTGRISVPLLVDKTASQIVSNQSVDIIKLLDTMNNNIRLVPGVGDRLHDEFEEIFKVVVSLWEAAYGAGYAIDQTKYEAHFDNYFGALDKLELVLSKRKYLTGNSITAADVRLFCNIYRFALVFYSLFKLNKKPLTDYHNLWNYVKEMHTHPEVNKTSDPQETKESFYKAYLKLSPNGIVPKGPELDFHAAHDRSKFNDSE